MVNKIKKQPQVIETKVDRDSLVLFFESINLVKDITFKEVLVDFQSKSITLYVKSEDKTFVVKGVYSGTFEPKGQVGIKDLGAFVSYLKSMEKEFSIAFLEGKAILKSSNSKISVVLKSSSYIVNSAEPEKVENSLKTLENQIEIPLTKETYKDISNQCKLFKSIELTIEGKENSLYLKTSNQENQNSLVKKYPLKNLNSDFKFILGNKIVQLFECLNVESIMLKIPKEKPNKIGLSVKTDSFSLDYILGLKVE